MSLEPPAGNPLAAFGGHAAVALAGAIARNKSRLKKPPLGPIGTLLSLSDPQWGQAIEASIGKIFDAYVVHCAEDLQTLKVRPVGS